MKKKLLISILLLLMVIIVYVIVILANSFDSLLGRFNGALSNNLNKNQIFSTVVEHEELLMSVLTEIANSQLDIEYISTTQKSKIYNPEYADLNGLYIRRDDSIYESIRNSSFDKVMNIKGLRSISVRKYTVDFNCGGSGFGSATSYYGFYYTEDKSILDGRGFEQKGNGWLLKEENGDNWYYTERIIENFYYYEEHY